MSKTASLLDDFEHVSKQDSHSLLAGVESLTDQVSHSWEQVDTFNPKLKPFSRITLAAMGGSHLGADIVRTALADRLNYPIEVSSEYTPAKHVNKDTLVIAISFSGNTEETNDYVEAAAEQGAQVLILAGGGKLIDKAIKNDWPHLQFDDSKNASKASRMGIGYGLALTIGVLEKVGALTFSDQDREDLQTVLLNAESAHQASIPTDQNPAKTLAFSAYGKRPVYMVAEHVVGAARAGVNQFHENAKLFADLKVIPEANHHLMEGLGFPDSNKHDHLFIFFRSHLYHPRNQKRFELTQDLFTNGLELDAIHLQLNGDSKLAEAVHVLSLLMYASVYASLLEKIDGGPLPMVDNFKSQL